MYILITGVNSILGVNICNYFIKKNHSVTGIYNNNTNNLKLISNKCKLVKLNLLRFDRVKLPNKIDLVIHIAAITDENNKNLLKVNYQGSKKLYDYSLSTNAKLFIFFSSISIELDKHNLNKKKYLISKKKAEKYFQKKRGTKVVSLRIPAILSPQLNKNLWIYKILKKIISNQKVRIYNETSYTNHFIYYRDIIKLINKLSITKNLKIYDEINLCSRGKIRILNLINMIKKITKSNSSIKYIKSKNINNLINSKKLENTYFFKPLNCKTSIEKFLLEKKNIIN